MTADLRRAKKQERLVNRGVRLVSGELGGGRGNQKGEILGSSLGKTSTRRTLETEDTTVSQKPDHGTPLADPDSWSPKNPFKRKDDCDEGVRGWPDQKERELPPERDKTGAGKREARGGGKVEGGKGRNEPVRLLILSRKERDKALPVITPWVSEGGGKGKNRTGEGERKEDIILDTLRFTAVTRQTGETPQLEKGMKNGRKKSHWMSQTDDQPLNVEKRTQKPVNN